MKVDGLPTIEGFAQIEMLEDIVSSCILGNSRFAVGSIEGKLQIFEVDTLLPVSYTHLRAPSPY